MNRTGCTICSVAGAKPTHVLSKTGTKGSLLLFPEERMFSGYKNEVECGRGLRMISKKEDSID
jgi:hypothetical protein